jgi:hypothetical protein
VIWFMFGGQPYRLTRPQLAEILEEISILFRQHFHVSYQRAPDLLIDETYAIHMALRKTLLPQSGYPEGFT